MPAQLPTFTVPTIPAHWRYRTDDYTDWPWEELTPLPPFILADGSAPAQLQTTVYVGYDVKNFYVRFDCQDTDIWGEATERDSAIYNEEVVELFIGQGEEVPTFYFEFEVSPLGTLLDLTCNSPDGDRRSMTTDFKWNCPDLQWSAERNDEANHWRAYLVVPWKSIGAEAATENELPRTWRANFYRIERPQGQAPEFSCWSPTMSEPADYHRPAHFGTLHLETT